MSTETLLETLKGLIDAGLTFSDCVAAFGDDDDDPYVVAAMGQQRDGELEIDTPTVVSRGADDGAYVMAWIWVDKADAGITDEDGG